VDVRMDSTPAGATVMIVDRDKTSFLGTTPVSAAIDPSRTYEVVFTAPDRSTQRVALDATTTTRLAVVLARASRASAAKLERGVKPVAKPAPLDAVASKPSRTAALDAPLEQVVAPVAPQARGVLMVSSKPPCEILIDGKPTGLTTPQRSISLPVGAHKVTLVNKAEGIKKTLSIRINADEPTKVIQDLMP
ncbi:MAG: hypothetical protein M3680_22765, partial [Myxococcota bacterium]|nr:hypothetical protein [Myxococcota bacterium]